MQLLNFLIITTIFWISGNAILRFLFMMIQEGGAIDLMFNWQNRLDKWYGKASQGSKFHKWLHDALGGCETCTSFWFAPVWFLVYMAFSKLVLGWFIDDYVVSIGAKIFVTFVWYIVFWSGAAVTGLAVLLFKKKK